MNMTLGKAKSKIQLLLENTVSRKIDIYHGLLLVHSDSLNIHWKFAVGSVGKEQ
jgi:hypothetical protein